MPGDHRGTACPQQPQGGTSCGHLGAAPWQSTRSAWVPEPEPGRPGRRETFHSQSAPRPSGQKGDAPLSICPPTFWAEGRRSTLNLPPDLPGRRETLHSQSAPRPSLGASCPEVHALPRTMHGTPRTWSPDDHGSGLPRPPAPVGRRAALVVEAFPGLTRERCPRH